MSLAAAATVDWDTAARLGARCAGRGPQLPHDHAAQVVAQLRSDALAAAALVHPVARLPHVPLRESDIAVVDRATWVGANVATFRGIVQPLLAKLQAESDEKPSAVAQAVTSRVAAAEIGGVLGFVGSRVLGQYDPYATKRGRLMLVAPNIVTAQTELAVPPEDFQLWVCLHEETHRLQFSGHPWLAPHLLARIKELARDMVGDSQQLADRLAQAVKNLSRTVRQGDHTGLLEAVQTPQQRQQLADLTAVMSLLEGHADVVMDAVGPQAVPSVVTIRQRFDKRRQGKNSLDRLLRRLLGMEAKMQQYTQGAAFVREVQRHVGIGGFNAVWQSSQHLPTAAEIIDPLAWVRRVHGW